jgi:hypothetical protein
MAMAPVLTAIDEADRHRHEARRLEHQRGLIDARGVSPSRLGRLEEAIRTRLAPDHSLTDYPCRLPDGRMGRVAVLAQGGDWVMVCRMA